MLQNLFLFTCIKDHKLYATFNCSDKQLIYDNDLNSIDTCLVLNPTKNLTNLFN